MATSTIHKRLASRRQITNAAARFWKMVDKSPDGCWMWKGSGIKNGHGQFTIRHRSTVCFARQVLAHRMAYCLATGVDPVGWVVRHTCDVPRCVRPSHLLIGTHKDNMQDAIERGRRKPRFTA